MYVISRPRIRPATRLVFSIFRSATCPGQQCKQCQPTPCRSTDWFSNSTSAARQRGEGMLITASASTGDHTGCMPGANCSARTTRAANSTTCPVTHRRGNQTEQPAHRVVHRPLLGWREIRQCRLLEGNRLTHIGPPPALDDGGEAQTVANGPISTTSVIRREADPHLQPAGDKSRCRSCDCARRRLPAQGKR